jgi:hypothetical protein
MEHILGSRKPAYEVPSYSLTGDVIAFARCGLQYRHTVIGRLPATRPAQLWFGQFVHGVLEEAYRRYKEKVTKKPKAVVNFSDDECREIMDLVAARLANQGLNPRSDDLREQGERRSTIALKELAPHMFPLISHAEVRLTGTRELPTHLIPVEDQLRNVERYEMAGVVDVITQLDLQSPSLASNDVAQLMIEIVGRGNSSLVEVIVDYKGMRRPPKANPKQKNDYRTLYERQIQTYSYLREAQVKGSAVVGGALIFLNELSPTWSDVDALKQEILTNKADVVPVEGTPDWNVIMQGKSSPTTPYPLLSFGFRLRRAVLLIKVNPDSVADEVVKFDHLVAEIEQSRGKEMRTGDINQSWLAVDTDQSMCTACDFRVTCPKDKLKTPLLPR